MSEKRFRYDSALEKVYDEDTYNGETTESYGIFECCEIMNELTEENEQLKQELQGMEELLQSYRKTIKHDAELLADATRNGYLPPLNDSVSNDGWICGCCKHFHSGVRDRCDKDNNWVLKDGSCQDFER